jgi:hypothetical protein
MLHLRLVLQVLAVVIVLSLVRVGLFALVGVSTRVYAPLLASQRARQATNSLLAPSVAFISGCAIAVSVPSAEEFTLEVARSAEFEEAQLSDRGMVLNMTSGERVSIRYRVGADTSAVTEFVVPAPEVILGALVESSPGKVSWSAPSETQLCGRTVFNYSVLIGSRSSVFNASVVHLALDELDDLTTVKVKAALSDGSETPYTPALNVGVDSVLKPTADPSALFTTLSTTTATAATMPPVNAFGQCIPYDPKLEYVWKDGARFKVARPVCAKSLNLQVCYPNQGLPCRKCQFSESDFTCEISSLKAGTSLSVTFKFMTATEDLPASLPTVFTTLPDTGKCMAMSDGKWFVDSSSTGYLANDFSKQLCILGKSNAFSLSVAENFGKELMTWSKGRRSHSKALSKTCGECFGKMAVCIRDNCKSDCASSLQNKKCQSKQVCIKCITDSCDLGLKTCTGLHSDAMLPPRLLEEAPPS